MTNSSNMTTYIPVIDNFFSIVRSEGFGYVKHICEFDKDIFELIDIKTISSPLEGGICHVTYHFKIKQTVKINSYIVFIEDYGDKKYMSETYMYDNLKNIIYLLQI